ncbi:MAG: DUF2914 domain-containing protein [Elusimicrobia bacterium]|nr:DUF2914 domain-containing protein [Elusimicrobiota bacterium]
MNIIIALALFASCVPVRADDTTAPAAPAAPALAAAAVAAVAATAPAVKVEKLTLASGIKDREPLDESAVFPTGFPVYCWLKYSVTNPPASIKYVWTADGKKVGEYPVDLKGEAGRWWAKKTVWPGAWKVEVVSDKGASLASAEFTVTAAAPKAEAPVAAPAAPATPK